MAEKEAWRIYFVGGSPLVSGSVPEFLYVKYPLLNIRTHHGYDGFAADTTVFQEIEEFAPHIVLVGMGMPLQERWIAYASKRVTTKLFLPCGATMDYVVGAQKAAPRWTGQWGLEWLFRLIHHPKALFRRYLQEPFFLLPLILQSLLKGESHVHTPWQPCPLGECRDPFAQ
jgi:N-acetylglucosaminyldiphosphoundecaprenol N-acetyl-beta-D-mannosaminyltransferase